MQVRQPHQLEMDNLVMDIFEEVIGRFTDYSPVQPVNAWLKNTTWPRSNRPKQYMHDHPSENITLEQLAAYCHISPFISAGSLRPFPVSLFINSSRACA